MAREGLRTLVVGKKVLSEEQYSSFEAHLRQARLSVTEREEQVHTHTTIIITRKWKIIQVDDVIPILSPAVYCGFGSCGSQRFTWWHNFLMDV